MTPAYYYRLYFARLKKLSGLGVQYPRKVFWRLQPKQVNRYGLVQLRTMQTIIRSLEKD